jgi:hypothetical protein
MTMDSNARLTKQGVRDLDFGVKRKPLPVPEQEPDKVVEDVDDDGDAVGAAEAIDGKVSRSPPAPAPKAESPQVSAVVVP